MTISYLLGHKAYGLRNPWVRVWDIAIKRFLTNREKYCCCVISGVIISNVITKNIATN
jgi:hypothetical protein